MVSMFLGADLLKWMVLALGGALFAGNVLAMVKPPPNPQEGDLELLLDPNPPMEKTFGAKIWQPEGDPILLPTG